MAISQLIFATLLPTLASVILYQLSKKGYIGTAGSKKEQIICGVVMGIVSAACSELGVKANGAIINVRDAAPICAGLIFGAPAGIIAGCIGGLERYFAVYWGAGVYTQLACALSTFLAGLFGAGLRRWMFDDKKTTWHYGLAAGFVMEVMHMLMVFFFRIEEINNAFKVVMNCAFPMITLNTLSVTLALVGVNLLRTNKNHSLKKHKELTQTFSRWLSTVVLIVFTVTGILTYVLQSSFSIKGSESLLKLNMADVKEDIQYASDENLLKLTRRVAADLEKYETIDTKLLQHICAQPGNDFSEISVINQEGIIAHSTNPAFINFDMKPGKQSGAFMVILSGEVNEYVQKYQPVSHDKTTMMKYAGVAMKRGGFVQVGYNSERFRQDVDTIVKGAARHRHVGKHGFLIISANDGTIVSNSHKNRKANENIKDLGLDLSPYQKYITEGKPFKADIYGDPSYCMAALVEDYYIIAAEPVEEILFSRNLSVYVTVSMEILVFAVLFIVVYMLIKKLVVENIHEINSALKKITNGNLDVSVNVRTNDEFISLSDDINSTVATLKGYIAQAAAKIDKELEMAKIIQSSTLPCVFPAYPSRTDFDIYASMDTAKEVGGDFYDFYLLDENRLVFLIADVSGKGITAAMFMMKAKTLIKGYAEKEPNSAAILTKANEALCEGNDAEMFVTCWLGILNFTTHTVDFANAGHNPPLVRHKNGSFEYFKSRPGFVLGGMEGIKYRLNELKLYPGDEIYLYTDGITEATDSSNKLYGESRLLNFINTLGNLTSKEICKAVKADTDKFVGEAPQFDDMTMLHLKLSPRNNLIIEPKQENMEKAVSFVESTLQDIDVPKKIIFKMNIAVDEILSNIIRYSEATEAELECNVSNGIITLSFTDNGKPYDPTTEADAPDLGLSAEDREFGGLGIFMVKKFMDSVTYTYHDARNILTLTKNFL